MTSEEILQLYIYILEEAGEGQYLHDPDSAASKLANLWHDCVRQHCCDPHIEEQIDAMIEEARATALEDYEQQMLNGRLA